LEKIKTLIKLNFEINEICVHQLGLRINWMQWGKEVMNSKASQERLYNRQNYLIDKKD
jgi:hypothetical protein